MLILHMRGATTVHGEGQQLVASELSTHGAPKLCAHNPVIRHEMVEHLLHGVSTVT